jgi:transposase InsO family protein
MCLDQYTSYNIKDESTLYCRKKYLIFKSLLEHNRVIKKGSGNKLTIKQIEEITGLSKSKYYRIKEKLENGNWKDIERKSTRPKTLRQSKIIITLSSITNPYSDNNNNIVNRVLKLRRENPTYGKTKLYAIVKREDDKNLPLSRQTNVSESTIGRILKHLALQSLIALKSNKLKKKLKDKKDTRPRNFKDTHSEPWDFKKHFQREEKYCKNKHHRTTIVNNKELINNKDRITEGMLIQIDHMKVNKNGQRFVQFSAIDPSSRYIVALGYNNPNSKNAKDFLHKTINKFPFEIKSIQVDGGSEFRKHFEEECKRLQIPLYVLPPYHPKYNGRVERSNKTFREDFYNSGSSGNEIVRYCNCIGEFNVELEKFVHMCITPIDHINPLTI